MRQIIDGVDKTVLSLLTFKQPSSFSVDVGGSSGVLSELLVPNDGNIFHIDEVTGTPAIDLKVNFSNLPIFSRVHVKLMYQGAANHYIALSMNNYSLVQYDCFSRSMHSPGTPPDGCDWISFTIPRSIIANYINSGAASLRIWHPGSGNSSHDLDIDFVGIEI